MLVWRVLSCIGHLESLDRGHLSWVDGEARWDRSSKCWQLKSGAEVGVGDSWECSDGSLLLHCVRTS